MEKKWVQFMCTHIYKGGGDILHNYSCISYAINHINYYKSIRYIEILMLCLINNEQKLAGNGKNLTTNVTKKAVSKGGYMAGNKIQIR